jgi:uncharacterized protein YciI
MPTFAVTYVYSTDTARLDAHRPEHRAFLRDLNARGVVRVSGPLPATGDAPAGALIVLDAEDAASVLGALDEDPFHREGLVVERAAREWVPVIGGFAAPA